MYIFSVCSLNFDRIFLEAHKCLEIERKHKNSLSKKAYHMLVVVVEGQILRTDDVWCVCFVCVCVGGGGL